MLRRTLWAGFAASDYGERHVVPGAYHYARLAAAWLDNHRFRTGSAHSPDMLELDSAVAALLSTGERPSAELPSTSSSESARTALTLVTDSGFLANSRCREAEAEG